MRSSLTQYPSLLFIDNCQAASIWASWWASSVSNQSIWSVWIFHIICMQVILTFHSISPCLNSLGHFWSRSFRQSMKWKSRQNTDHSLSASLRNWHRSSVSCADTPLDLDLISHKECPLPQFNVVVMLYGLLNERAVFTHCLCFFSVFDCRCI